MTGDGRHIDEVPRFLQFHHRQTCGNTVQHPFEVYIDHSFPFVDLEPSKRRLRHQPGIVDHHVDSTVGLGACVDQSLDLVAVGYVRRDGERFAAAVTQFAGQRLKARGLRFDVAFTSVLVRARDSLDLALEVTFESFGEVTLPLFRPRST